jgi:glycosyltransferase involved in cell wall biosynthesis
MAHGLAIVVSDGAGNPEAVGNAGVVVPAGADGMLAMALRALAASPAERARLGAAARERVGGHFSLKRMLAEVEKAYLRALT